MDLNAKRKDRDTSPLLTGLKRATKRPKQASTEDGDIDENHHTPPVVEEMEELTFDDDDDHDAPDPDQQASSEDRRIPAEEISRRLTKHDLHNNQVPAVVTELVGSGMSKQHQSRRMLAEVFGVSEEKLGGYLTETRFKTSWEFVKVQLLEPYEAGLLFHEHAELDVSKSKPTLTITWEQVYKRQHAVSSQGRLHGRYTNPSATTVQGYDAVDHVLRFCVDVSLQLSGDDGLLTFFRLNNTTLLNKAFLLYRFKRHERSKNKRAEDPVVASDKQPAHTSPASSDPPSQSADPPSQGADPPSQSADPTSQDDSLPKPSKRATAVRVNWAPNSNRTSRRYEKGRPRRSRWWNDYNPRWYWFEDGVVVGGGYALQGTYAGVEDWAHDEVLPTEAQLESFNPKSTVNPKYLQQGKDQLQQQRELERKVSEAVPKDAWSEAELAMWDVQGDRYKVLMKAAGRYVKEGVREVLNRREERPDDGPDAINDRLADEEVTAPIGEVGAAGSEALRRELRADEHTTAYMAKLAAVNRATTTPTVSRDTYHRALKHHRIRRCGERQIAGQTTPVNLTWWQLTGSMKIDDKKRQSELSRAGKSAGYSTRGFICADGTGSGKTNTACAWLLNANAARKRSLQRLHDEQRWDELSRYEDPTPFFWFTLPNLVHQAARDFKEFSSQFRVYIYGGQAQHGTNPAVPDGVTPLAMPLTNVDELFDPVDESNSHVIIICSYPTFAMRHGLRACRAWEAKQGTSEANDAPFNPKWPGNLRGKVRRYGADECHYSKNPDTQVWRALDNLQAKWALLLSATPAPYRFGDLLGPLGLVQDCAANEEALRMIKDGTMDDPYFDTVPNDQRKYRLTVACMRRYIPETGLSLEEQARKIKYIYDELVMRRDLHSTCEINAQGDIHRLGMAMPTFSRFCITMRNNDKDQAIYDEGTRRFGRSVFMTSQDKPGQHIICGRTVRAYNLASVCAPFAYIDRYLNAKDSKDDLIEAYNRGGGELLFALMDDILSTEATLQFKNHFLPPNVTRPLRTQAVRCAQCFLHRSIRLRTFVVNLADQVVRKREKALVFCQSPLEQMFVRELLRVLNLKAEALLSDHDDTLKEDVKARFGRPIPPITEQDREDGIEILIMSYAQNAGMNLHTSCHNFHALSPACSESALEQAIGRIVRFGQRHHCVIYEYYVDGTYNTRQVKSNWSKALVNFALLLSEEALDPEYRDGDVDAVVPKRMTEGYVLVDGELVHQSDPACPLDQKQGQCLSYEEVIFNWFRISRHDNIAVRDDRHDRCRIRHQRVGSPIFDRIQDIRKAKLLAPPPQEPQLVRSDDLEAFDPASDSPRESLDSCSDSSHSD